MTKALIKTSDLQEYFSACIETHAENYLYSRTQYEKTFWFKLLNFRYRGEDDIDIEVFNYPWRNSRYDVIKRLDYRRCLDKANYLANSGVNMWTEWDFGGLREVEFYKWAEVRKNLTCKMQKGM
jgi:hypothetical protein